MDHHIFNDEQNGHFYPHIIQSNETLSALSKKKQLSAYFKFKTEKLTERMPRRKNIPQQHPNVVLTIKVIIIVIIELSNKVHFQ